MTGITERLALSMQSGEPVFQGADGYIADRSTGSEPKLRR
jgi:hypothetical protein